MIPTISPLERKMNILHRAMSEFDFMPEDQDTFENVIINAENEIMKNVDYDYISECELHQHQHQHLFWGDGMGYECECDGEIVDFGYCNWWRWNDETFLYEKISKWDADNENDYCECDRVIDSEGQVVLLLAK